MRITDTSVYLGPNLYARFPVIRLSVDLGELEQWPTGRLGRAFQERLLEWLPGLAEHGCSFGEPGGFLRRMSEGDGTWLGHVVEHVAIELQAAAGADVSFGKTRSADGPGRYHVVYEYEHGAVGQEAGRLAVAALLALLPEELRVQEHGEEDFDFTRRREGFIRFAQQHDLGPSTASLVKAARERDIPWIRLNEQSLIQFGHGKWQRRIQATITSETRHIAVEIASDKEETTRILGDLGLPVPRQQLVYGEDEAAKQADRMGYPVVVKPLNANHGRGVSIRMTNSAQVRDAFQAARQHARGVLVESFIDGFDHRMLVVDGQLVAVAKRVPGHVIGDGERTIEQLVERVNADPRRGIGHEKILTRLEFDPQAERLLEQRGYDRASVPPAGEVVFLRSTGNLSTGGTSTDVTDIVHPDNVDMAIRAARAIGLDVAGVDFLTPDITQSHRAVGGAICEVNAAPGFRMHVAPSEGRSRDVAGPVMEMLFPKGTPSRIPIAAVTGTNGKTTTARMLAHVLKLKGHATGLATTDGIYINGQRTVEGDMTGPVAARMVLRDPSVDVAVLETARGGLLRAGMGYRHCDVGACLNVAADHLGLRGIETLEELALVKRIVIEVAKGTAVLNADDPLCLRMADYSEAAHLCYVTTNPAHGLVKQHVQAGGQAVVLEEGINGQMITLYDKGAHVPLLWTHLIPATMEGRAQHNVQNAMFAAAMAHALGVKLEDVRHGLRTFDTTFFQAPGRMNVFSEHPFKVIVDYGHNPAAVEAMCRLVERLDVRGRRTCVLAAPGDRRDEDIAAIARVTAGTFDRWICRRDDGLRGRGPDEVPRMLRDALLAAGVESSRIEVIPDEREAVDTALRTAERDDLLLIFADAITRTWKQVTHFRPDVEGTPTAVTTPSPHLRPPPGDVDVEGGATLIRDERGVRLPREEDD